MILFIGLLLALVFAVVMTVLAITVGGSIGIVVFGEVIICVQIIVCIIKHSANKKKCK